MAEVLTKLFSKSGRVLVKGGDFNQVEGRYERIDRSQHITNVNCNNMIGNHIHNSHNLSHQTIYHGPNARSNHHSSRSAQTAIGRVATTDTRAMNNHALQVNTQYQAPRSQAPIQGWESSVYSSSFTMDVRSPGQHAYTQPGDVRSMMPAEFDFMKRQMALMSQEMDDHFGAEDGDEDVSSEDEIPAGMRSPSLTSDFQRLTIDERVSPSARSAPAHAPFPYNLNTQEIPRYFVEGDLIEVDDSRHEINVNSHRVANNIVENSFGEKGGEVIEQISTVRKVKQAHVPKKGSRRNHDRC